MDEKILAAIDQEIARLQQARVLLLGTNVNTSNFTVENKRKRTLSAKARKAIAEAQRKRWAKVKSGRANKPAA
jgi:hypothetical protein